MTNRLGFDVCFCFLFYVNIEMLCIYAIINDNSVFCWFVCEKKFNKELYI